MNRQYHRKHFRIVLILTATLSLCCWSHADATGLITGHYIFRARYPGVCLAGTYPMSIAGMDTQCTMTLQTDALGNLTGSVNVRTFPGQLTGTIKLRNDNVVHNSIELDLQMSAQNPTNQPADLYTFLHSTQFLGQAENCDGASTFTMDVSAAEPLIVTFDLNLVVNGQGQITGNGTASSCAVQVPVTVTGTSSANCNLHIVGTSLPQFIWDGSGPATAFGFVASWTGNGFGFSPSGAQLPIFAPNAAALTPYVTSRKDHLAQFDHIPAFITCDINLPVTGTPGVECRSGGSLGIHQLAIVFPKNVTLNPPNGIPAVRVSSGIGTVSKFLVTNNEVIVNLTGVADAQTLMVTLAGVNDGSNMADVVVPDRFLLGDITGNGVVNASDISQVKSQVGAVFSTANCRSDVNLNGAINSSDVALVKSKTGTAVPQMNGSSDRSEVSTLLHR